MDDLELMKIAVFKLGEAARRMGALASTARTPGVQRLLAAAAQLLAAQQEELRVTLDGALPEPEEEPQVDGVQPRRRRRPAADRQTKLRLAAGGRP